MIDYSPAGEFAREVRAFAIIESNEDESKMGDGGRAFGILQMHPATFMQYYSLHSRESDVSDTWTKAQIKACAAFLWHHKWRSTVSWRATESVQVRRDLIVQAWNLGVYGVFSAGKRNPEYLARWREAYDRIKVEDLGDGG